MKKSILFVGLLACVALFAVPAFAADTTPVTATPPVVVATAVDQPVAEVTAVDQPVQLTDDEMGATKGEDGKVWIRCVGYSQAWKNSAYAYAGTVVIKRIAGSGWANATGLHWGGNNEIHYWRWITPNQTMKNLGLGNPGLMIDRSTLRW